MLLVNPTIPPPAWLDDVCRVSRIPASMLLSKSRYKTHVRLRQAVMFVLRRKARASLPQIGRMLCGMDHSTVLFGVGKFDAELRRKDPLTLRCYRIAIRAYVKHKQETISARQPPSRNARPLPQAVPVLRRQPPRQVSAAA